jgi:Zn-dependent membrane protease YugP
MPVFLIVLAVLAVSLWVSARAGNRYQGAMARGARLKAPKGWSGAEAARRFLQSEGVADVQIVPHQGVVTDYFDPARRRLFLSRRTGEAASLAAWAVALHEAAHATQSGSALPELRWRHTCIRLCRYLPTLSAILLAILSVLKVMTPKIAVLLFAMVWSLTFLLNAGTLAVEWNANLRLRRFLDRELEDYPDARDEIDSLLAATATRELADLANSPRYFFLSALPGTSKLRPGDRPPPQPGGDKPA